MNCLLSTYLPTPNGMLTPTSLLGQNFGLGNWTELSSSRSWKLWQLFQPCWPPFWWPWFQFPPWPQAALENHYCLFLSKRESARLLSKVNNTAAGNLVVVVFVTSFYSNRLFLIVFRVSIPQVEIVIPHRIPIFRSVTESFRLFKKI